MLLNSKGISLNIDPKVNPTYIAKKIQYFSQTIFVACDACCDKAWGIDSRPRVDEDNDDDVNFLLDDALDQAPIDPGVYEGHAGKPSSKDQRLNKWCARQCERSVFANHRNEIVPELKMKNLELTGKEGTVSDELVIMINN